MPCLESAVIETAELCKRFFEAWPISGMLGRPFSGVRAALSVVLIAFSCCLLFALQFSPVVRNMLPPGAVLLDCVLLCFLLFFFDELTGV